MRWLKLIVLLEGPVFDIVVAGNQSICFFDYRDPASESTVHLGKFETDLAAADDDCVKSFNQVSFLF